MRIILIAAIALIMAGCKDKPKVAEMPDAPPVEAHVPPADQVQPEPVKPADPKPEEKLKEVEAKAKECDCKCPPKSKKSKDK